MTSAEIKFAVIISVGPNESDIALDTLDSLKHFYPHCDVWILDDGTHDGTYKKLRHWTKTQSGVHLFQNKKSNGFFFLTRSLAYLLSKVLDSHKDYEFILKIDTDTLFVKGGLDKMIAARFAEEGPGIVGNYRRNAYGKLRCYKKMRRKMMLDVLPVGYARKFKQVRVGEVSYLPYLQAAKKHGYRPGDNVFAACYAYHIDTVKHWNSNGYLEALLNLKPCLVFEDDVLMSVGAAAIGHKLIEMEPNHHERQHCWLEWGISELSIPLEQVLAEDYCVLHPLKQVPGAMQMREYFREKRQMKPQESRLSEDMAASN